MGSLLGTSVIRKESRRYILKQGGYLFSLGLQSQCRIICAKAWDKDFIFRFPDRRINDLYSPWGGEQIKKTMDDNPSTQESICEDKRAEEKWSVLYYVYL